MLRDPVLGPILSVIIIVMGFVMLGDMRGSVLGTIACCAQIAAGVARLGLQVWMFTHGG